jgi:hypothetical protein
LIELKPCRRLKKQVPVSLRFNAARWKKAGILRAAPSGYGLEIPTAPEAVPVHMAPEIRNPAPVCLCHRDRRQRCDGDSRLMP